MDRLAKEEYNILVDIINDSINTFCREHNVLCFQSVIVATYNSETRMATVYFPTDMTIESSPYRNLTNEDLVVGQKVYIYYKYGDIEQGWISVK